MRNIVLELSYDGTKYSGWQRQGNTANTIENKITTVLNRILDTDKIELHGSGRTDSGVHAFKQVANFKTISDLSTDNIIKDLNKYLPQDIRVKRIYEANERFHSRLSATGKVYKYIIDNSEYGNVFYIKHATFDNSELDINKMIEASKYLIGAHDFKSFTDLKSDKKSTVREIYDIQISKTDDIITISFDGNGFLYHMVRILVSVLLMTGKGIINPLDVKNMLEAKIRDKNIYPAPPEGLILYDVRY